MDWTRWLFVGFALWISGSFMLAYLIGRSIQRADHQDDEWRRQWKSRL